MSRGATQTCEHCGARLKMRGAWICEPCYRIHCADDIERERARRPRVASCDMDDYQPMFLALIDAASNCAKQNAEATLTTRAGAAFSGSLDRPPRGSSTAHLHTRGGGWATVLISDIAAVSVEARR